MAKKNNKDNTEKEESTEVFEVEKGNKEKIVQKDVNTEIPKSKAGQIKHQKKVLAIILASLIGILLLVFGIYYYVDSLRHQDYKGVEFITESHGDLVFHKATVPVEYQGEIVPYNVYLRTKINELKKIPFDSQDFKLMKFAVLNFTDQFDCNDGDEVIAVANLKNVHETLGMQILSDPEAGCDSEGRYSYYNLMKSDETKIEKIGEQCYNVHVSNCEILPATEKIIAEILYHYQSQE